MKRFLCLIVFSLLYFNSSYAKNVTLTCKVNNPKINFEINDRVFDTKNGHYVTIKKRAGLETNNTKYKFSTMFKENNKFTFFWQDQDRLQPFEGDVLKNYSVGDMLLMPIIKWTHEDPKKLSTLSVQEFIDGMLVHVCVPKLEKEYSKKEFKELIKRSKNLTSFELIETYARESKDKTLKLENRIIQKEIAFNQKIKENHDIDHSFSFEDKSGNKISKNNDDGLWNKFWGAVGWVLYEHGEDIFNLAVDLKYGTTQTTQTPKMYCTSQRVGNSKIVHTTCRQR